MNGRIASQFAPLVQAVHGRSTYDALFELACRRGPRLAPRRAGRRRRQLRAPGLRGRVRRGGAGARAPTSRCSSGPGLLLSEQGVNDAQSYRLAILYGVGETREEAVARCRERAADAQLSAGAGCLFADVGRRLRPAPPGSRSPTAPTALRRTRAPAATSMPGAEPVDRGVAELGRDWFLASGTASGAVRGASKTSEMTSPMIATAMRLPSRETVELTPEAMPA